MANLNNSGNKHSAMTSQSSPSGKQNSSSIQVKVLTKSEIESLRQSKIDAYHQMMKMPL